MSDDHNQLTLMEILELEEKTQNVQPAIPEVNLQSAQVSAPN